MEYRKKAYITLIMAILMLSLVIAMVPRASASPIAAPEVWDTESPYAAGPVGEEVKVNGTATTPGGKIEIYWDEVHAWDSTDANGLLGSTYSKPTKYYEFNFTVPEAVAGDHAVVVKDIEAVEINSTTYTVEPEIELSPDVGMPDDTVAVTGTGFGEELDVRITFWNASWTKNVTTTTSSVLGSFTKTFTVPDVDDGDYTVNATDTDGNNATALFTVSHLYILLDPTEGSKGSTVDIEGRGFTHSSTVDIYFGTDVYPAGFYQKVRSGVATDSNGDFSTSFTVPSAEKGFYIVTAIDAEDVWATAEFELTPTAEIALDPDSGLQGIDVDVTGSWFTADSTVTIYFDLEVLAEDVSTDSDGNFTETVTIPEDATMGDHVIKAEDEEGLKAQETFTVREKVTVIAPRRGSVYRQGETVSFYVNSSVVFESNIELEIQDGSGYPFDTLLLVPEEIDDTYVVAYTNATFTLPSDALLGDWNWTATYTMEGDEVEDTGRFTVAAMSYDEILTKLGDLDAKLVALDGDVATLSTSVGSITTSLSDIGLKVESLSGDTATIKTNLGTISGTVTSIDGNIATIKTDIGTVKADISAAKSSADSAKSAADSAKSAADSATSAANSAKSAADNATSAANGLSGLLWGAIILALIAALAAIYAVLTIRRKIAG